MRQHVIRYVPAELGYECVHCGEGQAEASMYRLGCPGPKPTSQDIAHFLSDAENPVSNNDYDAETGADAMRRIDALMAERKAIDSISRAMSRPISFNPMLGAEGMRLHQHQAGETCNECEEEDARNAELQKVLDDAIAIYETPKALSDHVTGREIAALLRLLKGMLHVH